MSELEDLIRDSMRGSEHQAPAGSGLLAQVGVKEHARRRRVQLASAAGTAAVVVAVVLAAGPFGHLAGTTTVNPGASPKPPAGVTGSPTSSPVQPSTSVTSSATPAGADNVCGSWSGESAPFAQTVAKRYGPIESCLLYDHTWVITTDGLNSGPGYIGLAGACTTSTCLSGATDHSHDTWTYHQATRPGSVRLYAPPVIGEPLQVTVGGVQQTFDVTTKTFAGQYPKGPVRLPGLLHGTLQMAGGPAPGTLVNVPGTVVFRASNGTTVTGHAAKDGTFTASVPQGTYTVTGSSPNYNGGAGRCGGETVTVPASEPLPTVHVVCQMK